MRGPSALGTGSRCLQYSEVSGHRAKAPSRGGRPPRLRRALRAARFVSLVLRSHLDARSCPSAPPLLPHSTSRGFCKTEHGEHPGAALRARWAHGSRCWACGGRRGPAGGTAAGLRPLPPDRSGLEHGRGPLRPGDPWGQSKAGSFLVQPVVRQACYPPTQEAVTDSVRGPEPSSTAPKVVPAKASGHSVP